MVFIEGTLYGRLLSSLSFVDSRSLLVGAKCGKYGTTILILLKNSFFVVADYLRL